MCYGTRKKVPCLFSLLSAGSTWLSHTRRFRAPGPWNPRHPPEVTDSTIAWGKQLFHGSANCAVCHGQDAWGTDEGPALTGAIWLHGPGTYEWLVEQIKLGIPAHETWIGKPMPMRGWSITHPPRPQPSKPRPA